MKQLSKSDIGHWFGSRYGIVPEEHFSSVTDMLYNFYLYTQTSDKKKRRWSIAIDILILAITSIAWYFVFDLDFTIMTTYGIILGFGYMRAMYKIPDEKSL